MRVFTNIFVILIFGFLCFKLSDTTAVYNKKQTRAVTLVDAYERYSDNGVPSWKGIFRDDKVGTRIEWDIEPRDYREFISTNQPKPMTVNATLCEINHPSCPSFYNFLAVFFGLLAFIAILWLPFSIYFWFDEKY